MIKDEYRPEVNTILIEIVYLNKSQKLNLTLDFINDVTDDILGKVIKQAFDKIIQD